MAWLHRALGRWQPGKRWGGWEGFAGGFVLPLRSSAAPAAHREQARSYVCFGPIIPVGFARERLGAWRDIASYNKAAARLPQA